MPVPPDTRVIDPVRSLNDIALTSADLLNAGGVAEGSQSPPAQHGTYRVPAPVGLKVTSQSYNPATLNSTFVLTWLDVTDSADGLNQAQVAGYRVYARLNTDQNQDPAQVGSSAKSPCYASVNSPTDSTKVTFWLQPFLTSGQTLPLSACPTCTGTTPVPTYAFDSTALATNWYNAAWMYRKSGSAAIVSGGANFPVLVSITDADLQAHAQTNGNDILFTASDGITKLNHEIETYDHTTGTLVAWVQIQSGTAFFMYYGNATCPNQQNVNATWDANYKGVWHLPNGSVLSKVDSTINANNGSGAASATTGQIDGAANVSAASISVLPSTSLQITGPITLSAWFNVGSFPGSGLTINPIGKGSGYFFEFDDATSPGTIIVDFGTNNGTPHGAGFAATTWSPGVWHHLAGSYDGTTWRIYFDGVLQGSSVDAVTPQSSASSLVFGGFNGDVDEVRVSNVARSAAWILDEYNNQSAPGSFVSFGAAQVSAGATVAVDSSRPIAIGTTTGLGVTSNSTPNLTTTVAAGEIYVQSPSGSKSIIELKTLSGTDLVIENVLDTVASAGSGGAVPATVQGYLVITIGGTTYKIPYFAA